MTHYELLGLAPTAEPSVIRAAYRARVAELHPDLASGPADERRRTAQTAALNEAYRVLADPLLRRGYDATLVPPRRAETRTERSSEPAAAPRPATAPIRRGPNGVPLRTPPSFVGQRGGSLPSEISQVGRWFLVDPNGQWAALALLGILALIPIPFGGSVGASANLFLSLGLFLVAAQGIASRRLKSGPLGLLWSGVKRLFSTLSPVRIR